MSGRDAFSAVRGGNGGDDGGDNDHDDITLSLPEPSTSAVTGEDVQQLRLGETVKLETMGPIIINSDGTTRKIENWEAMTEAEQKKTRERISKRNAERLEKLRKQQQGGDESSIK